MQGRQLAGTQLCDGFANKAARCVELAAEGGVLGAVQGRDDILPALSVALVQPGLHLADRLRCEQEAAARIVKDRACDLELASRPQDDLLSRVGVELFRTQHLHRPTILVQAR
jgi:hypothetical protein